MVSILLAPACLNKKRATLIFSNSVAREDPRLNLAYDTAYFTECNGIDKASTGKVRPDESLMC